MYIHQSNVGPIKLESRINCDKPENSRKLWTQFNKKRHGQMMHGQGPNCGPDHG